MSGSMIASGMQPSTGMATVASVAPKVVMLADVPRGMRAVLVHDGLGDLA